MVGRIILGIIVGIIVLILVVPIGADINYEGGELRVSAKLWKLLINVFPKEPADPDAPPKEKKPKRIKKKKPKEPAEGEPAPKKKLKLDFTFDEIMALLKKLFKGLGTILTIHVDRFMLHYVAAGDDPYDTAVTYNYVNAALSTLAPICAKKYRCRDTDVWTDIDFTREQMQLDVGIAVTVRLGQIFHGVNIILFGALGILIKNKMRLFSERLRAKKEKTVDDDTVIEIEETKEENIQEEERIE